MKQRKTWKLAALLLAMVMLFAAPMEASAAIRKVTAKNGSNYKKAPALKKGKNIVTYKTKVESAQINVKFTATATKTYTFTICNLRNIGSTSKKSDIWGNVYFYSGYKKLSSGASAVNYTKYTESGKKKSDGLMIQSAGCTFIKQYKTSRTVKIAMKKGQTVYLGGYLNSTQGKYDVIIK